MDDNRHFACEREKSNPKFKQSTPRTWTQVIPGSWPSPLCLLLYYTEKKKKLHWENLIEAIVLLLVLLVSMNCHFLARKSGIWNTSEVAVLCSYLFLSIDCYWVSWQLSLMQALQMPVDRKNESQPVQSWITLYVTMNESLRYRTIQKALFQTYFMDENHFSAYTHSLLNQSAVFNIPEEELDPWYEKRTFWQNTECLIFMNYYYFSFTFK